MVSKGEMMSIEACQCGEENQHAIYFCAEDCIDFGTHLTCVDNDGYCNFCGTQLGDEEDFQ